MDVNRVHGGRMDGRHLSCLILMAPSHSEAFPRRNRMSHHYPGSVFSSAVIALFLITMIRSETGTPSR